MTTPLDDTTRELVLHLLDDLQKVIGRRDGDGFVRVMGAIATVGGQELADGIADALLLAILDRHCGRPTQRGTR